jgi:hypothetical protein
MADHPVKLEEPFGNWQIAGSYPQYSEGNLEAVS